MNSGVYSVDAAVEQLVIPTYVPREPEEFPMFSEFRHHQNGTGYVYPNRVTTRTERETLTEMEYTVVRLENEFIRIIVLPALGGRIFEGYDKKNDYHFFYRHSRIKPVLVGTYGNWISGGLEFNFPHHHRPSTYLPVDYELERLSDGSAVCWISEASPSSGQYRMKGTIGIKLRPDTSYLETIVRVVNRTEREHPFMMFENAGIHVNPDYEVFFPPDVTYAHHHYDRHHTTWPFMRGWYAVDEHVEISDIRWHKNTIMGTSYFAGPSRFDFFGGYDHRRDCGTVHVGDHHVSPGKKNFQWGLNALGDAWNAKLTDTDGEHAELMAGSYADDQPDFTWLAPYETKTFSQYWYPIHGVKAPVFANLAGALSVDRHSGLVRIATTSVIEDGEIIITSGNDTLLRAQVSLAPSQCQTFKTSFDARRYSIQLVDRQGTELLSYSEVQNELVEIPKDNPGIPTPHQLTTPQQIYIAGRHIDQYRDPLWRGDEYYHVALERDPEYIPALLGMAEHQLDNAFYQEALTLIKRVEQVQNVYNHNPSDGLSSYLKGLALLGLGDVDEAYEVFYKAAWSVNVIPGAMSFIAAIDGLRGDFAKMKAHAEWALAHDAWHPLAGPYRAIALWKGGDSESALGTLETILNTDKLNHLARYLVLVISGSTVSEFFDPGAVNSNASQTVCDVVYDLLPAGLFPEAHDLLVELINRGDSSIMTQYLLAYINDEMGDTQSAQELRLRTKERRDVDVFPYRPVEIKVLQKTCKKDPQDAMAAYLLGCILYDKRHYAEAADCWERAVESSPDFYQAYRVLAIAYFSKLSRRTEALDLLRKAVSLKPKDDILLKEINFVMASVGIDDADRLQYLLDNLPDDLSDNLTMDVAYAYIDVGNYEQAVAWLEKHNFVPAECCETYLTEAYTLANVCLGREALLSGDKEAALAFFRKAQTEPPGFDAGWWDWQALDYARYYEALVLDSLGRIDERNQLIKAITTVVLSNASPYMGPERFYYVAAAMRMAGDDLGARVLISERIAHWQAELEDDHDRKLVATALFISYTNDPVKLHRSSMLTALAYGRLFFGDTRGAVELFHQALTLDPDNRIAKTELRFIG